MKKIFPYAFCIWYALVFSFSLLGFSACADMWNINERFPMLLEKILFIAFFFSGLMLPVFYTLFMLKRRNGGGNQPQ